MHYVGEFVIIGGLDMVAFSGPLATISCELRQAWKGATVATDSCAGVWLVWVATRRGVRAVEGARLESV